MTQTQQLVALDAINLWPQTQNNLYKSTYINNMKTHVTTHCARRCFGQPNKSDSCPASYATIYGNRHDIRRLTVCVCIYVYVYVYIYIYIYIQLNAYCEDRCNFKVVKLTIKILKTVLSQHNNTYVSYISVVTLHVVSLSLSPPPSLSPSLSISPPMCMYTNMCTYIHLSLSLYIYIYTYAFMHLIL